jgi:hypothetical protein
VSERMPDKRSACNCMCNRAGVKLDFKLAFLGEGLIEFFFNCGHFFYERVSTQSFREYTPAGVLIA